MSHPGRSTVHLIQRGRLLYKHRCLHSSRTCRSVDSTHQEQREPTTQTIVHRSRSQSSVLDDIRRTIPIAITDALVAIERRFSSRSESSTPTAETKAVQELPKVAVEKSEVVAQGLPAISKTCLKSRTKYLVASLTQASNEKVLSHRVQELVTFLKAYPTSKHLAVKAEAVRTLLYMQRQTELSEMHDSVREALTLLGHTEPPKSPGIRILSIDGGGLRGLMTIEFLRELEKVSGRPCRELFDYICGVSTGAILAILIGPIKATLDECEELYKSIGTQIFQQNPLWGTSKLVWSHAYYDTELWTKMIKDRVGSMPLIETSRDATCPKVAAVSTVVNLPQLRAFLFRNYEYPVQANPAHLGTSQAALWEAIRSSAAAPGYFEEYKLADLIHQDGGVLVNNPAALSIHECKQLWPSEGLQCVVSIGSGRYAPLTPAPSSEPVTGLKNKLLKILDSATDTEAVHLTLQDLLPNDNYFRFNPYLSELIALNETRQEKLEQLQHDTRMYLRKNQRKLHQVATLLTQKRSVLQSAVDSVKIKARMYI